MMRTRQRVAMLLAAAAVSHGVFHSARAADPRSPVQGNPVETLPRIPAPDAGTDVNVQVARPDQALQKLLSSTLTPRHFRIEGVKSLPFDEVAAEFAPLAGRTVTVAALLAAADAVTERYKARGYPLSFAFIPAQRFHNGDVLVTVVEGYVADVTVKGNAGPLRDRLLAIVDELRDERPLTRASFERQAAVLALQPGVQIKATVQPPRTTDGASEMVLEVQRKPFAVGTALDYVSPGVRGIATATLSGLTPLGEQLAVSALYPRGRDDERYYAASYTQPIGTGGAVFRINAWRYRGKPRDDSLAALGYDTRYVNDSRRLGASLSYPLILGARHTLTAAFGVYGNNQYQRFRSDLLPGAVTIGARVRVLSAELAYLHRGEGVTRQATLSVFRGIDALGARRENSSAALQFWRSRLAVSQALDLPWGFGLSVAGTAQYSAQRLASSEQISVGGRVFGQGYPAGEAAGDKGWGASVELSRLFAPDMTWLRTVQPYVSADMAKVHLNGTSHWRRSLASLALGMRISDRRHYTLDLSFAQPVGDRPVNASRRSPRINASYSYQFD